MTESGTIDRPAKPANKPPVRKHDEAGHDLVVSCALAAHLGISRQGVDALASQGVLTRRLTWPVPARPQATSRMKHLKAERRGLTSTAAQATRLRQTEGAAVELRIAKQERVLMPVADHEAFN